MTTMQKFKAYFGMVPPNEYDDDYFDDQPDDRQSARERTYMEKYRSTSMREEPFYEDDEYREAEFRGEYRDAGYREPEYADVREPAMRESARFDAPRGYAPRFERPHVAARRAEAPRRVAEEPIRSRLEPLERPSLQVRGANAIAPDARPEPEVVVDTAAKISTLRPADYSEARTIGERYRDGNPVIIDLVDLSNDDAKRLVDFAAGLAFALRGSLEKVATKVFLLSPAGIDVSPEQRRRIAETGYSSQS